LKAALREAPGRVARHLRRGAAAYGIFIVSLLLTALAWHYVRANVHEQNTARFRETVRVGQETIDRRTNSYVDALLGARGLILASKSVTSEEWSNYVSGIMPKDRFKGLQALGYAEYVSPKERASFTARAKKQGLPSLSPDLNPGGGRPAYFPLTFVEPRDAANTTMLDHDMYIQPEDQAAMDRARDTGKPTATSRVYILTEAPPGVDADLSLKPGFAVYLPVYRKGEPQGTSDERRKALKGFVVGCFKMDGLLEGIFGSALDPTLDFEVYDGKNTSESNLLYDDDGVRRAGQGYPGYSSSSRIDVAGRNWTLFFSASPEFGRDATSRLPLFVLLTGVATSFLLFVVVWMLVRSRDRAERASEDLEDANRELEGTNSELEAFSYSVSHDLRAPLRTIDGFSQILLEDYGDSLDAEGEDYLNRVRAASQHMGVLIDDLLDLSRVTRSPLRRERVDLSEMAKNIAGELRRVQPDRDIDFVIEESLIVQGDANLLSVALRNLLGNAWKFTSRKPGARVEFGADRNPGPGFLAPVYFVRDNGAGFEMAYAQRLFGAFQRLHHSDEFEGTGIGLATVQRIIHRHGGRVWAEGEPGRGATFHFTLGTGARQSAEPLPRKAEVA